MGLLQEEDVFGEYRIFHNHDSKLLRILYVKLNISRSQVNIEMVSLFFLSLLYHQPISATMGMEREEFRGLPIQNK